MLESGNPVHATQAVLTIATSAFSAGQIVADLVVQIGGNRGHEAFVFESGDSIDQIVDRINLETDATGTMAFNNAGVIELESSQYGRDAFVDIYVVDEDEPGWFEDALTSTRVYGSGVYNRLNVLDNDINPDGGEFKLLDAVAEFGTVEYRADGEIEYLPPVGFIGNDVIEYQAGNAAGTSNGSVRVNVHSPLFQLPANEVLHIVNESEVIELAIEPPRAAPRHISIENVHNGSATIVGEGKVSFQAAPGSTGVGLVTLRFDYRSHNSQVSRYENLYVFIESDQTNSVSVGANVGEVVVAEDQIVVLSLENSHDADGQLRREFGSTNQTAGDMVQLSDGRVLYVPPLNSTEEDQLIVRHRVDGTWQEQSLRVRVEGQADIFFAQSMEVKVEMLPTLERDKEEEAAPARLAVDLDPDGLSGRVLIDIEGSMGTERFTFGRWARGIQVASAADLVRKLNGVSASFERDSIMLESTEVGRRSRIQFNVLSEQFGGELTAETGGSIRAIGSGSANRIDLFENQSHPDDLPFDLESASAQFGSVEFESNGTLFYTPVWGQMVDRIEFTLRDEDGARAASYVDVRVQPLVRSVFQTDRLPIALAGDVALLDATESLAKFGNGDVESLRVLKSSQGNAVGLRRGTVLFRSPTEFSGLAVIVYEANFANGESVVGELPIYVEPRTVPGTRAVERANILPVAVKVADPRPKPVLNEFLLDKEFGSFELIDPNARPDLRRQTVVKEVSSEVEVSTSDDESELIWILPSALKGSQ